MHSYKLKSLHVHKSTLYLGKFLKEIHPPNKHMGKKKLPALQKFPLHFFCKFITTLPGQPESSTVNNMDQFFPVLEILCTRKFYTTQNHIVCALWYHILFIVYFLI
jgi:hypothetical protein